MRYSAVSTLKTKRTWRWSGENEAGSWPHASVVSFSPFSCAGLTTNILIVFTLTATWGAAERPAQPLLQSWDHSDRGGLISGQTFSHYLLHSHPEWKWEVLFLTPTSYTISPPSQQAVGKYSRRYKKKKHRKVIHILGTAHALWRGRGGNMRTHMLIHAVESTSHTLTSRDPSKQT